MSTHKNLITLCFATVFALGLAACGGGGGSSPTTSGDAPMTGDMPDDASLVGKYIPSGTTFPDVDLPDTTLTAASGESLTLPGLGTVECASADGCSGTVADGTLTITGHLKIVSVDPALDTETAMAVAGVAVDMLPELPALDTALMDAQMAADRAATLAEDAATAAEAAVTAQDGNMAADAASYAVANNAAMRARAAATAARGASDAAAATDDTAAAEAHQAIAEAKKGDAETEQDNAEMYAGMVADAQQAIDDENQRQIDVAAARTGAMGSYIDADADATKAEDAADAAEATAPGSPGAIAAREAATAAREAADAAKTAHDAIMDDMTKVDADAQAGNAATAAMTANSAYKTAKAENDTIQTASIIGQQQQEARDLAAAKKAAEDLYNDAADGVTFHYDAVVGKAADASTQATNARNSANRAARARTDATKAGEQADMAETASSEAQAALGRAMTAKAGADTARQDAIDATTSEDANTALGNLRTANAALTEEHTGMTGAGMAYMRARDAAADAEMYANMHVLGLFMRANAYDIEGDMLDDSGTPELNEFVSEADRRKAEIASIGAVMALAANATDGGQRGDAQTSAAWAADDPATPDADAVSGWAHNLDHHGLSVNITSDTVGDPDTDPDPKNADIIDGVDGFTNGFDVASGQVRVIAFTDREQSVLAQDAVNFARYIDYGEGEGETIAITEVSSLGESPDGGLSYPGTLTKTEGGAVMGTFTCTLPNCSIALNDDGTGVDAITGYTFTGTRTAKAAVAADPNEDYLLFGLWLDEAAGGADSFGAFAGGGQVFTSGNVPPLTGTASYSGEAVGAHHKTGEGVNWFTGDASLTANFMNADEAGTIEGSISNISVNGGDAMSNPINLARSTIEGNTFNGPAVMGAQTRPGEEVHSYNGTWSGGFFNNPVGEDLEGDDLHPGSVAGTFGVTRSDDMGTTTGEDPTADDVTESFVGAFGAHKN